MRLIDADALLKDITDYPYGYRGMIKDTIARQPTVAPKQGHWISCDNDGDSPYKCSVCGGVKVNKSGEWLDICHQEWSKMPYCPLCGAKMDEEET